MWVQANLLLTLLLLLEPTRDRTKGLQALLCYASVWYKTFGARQNLVALFQHLLENVVARSGVGASARDFHNLSHKEAEKPCLSLQLKYMKADDVLN